VGGGEGGVVGFLRTAASFFRSAAGGVGVVQDDFTLGDAGFDVVQLGVEDADLAEVAAFEGFELSTEMGKLGFAFGEGGADGGKLLALGEEGGVVRSLLEDDFGWHTASAGRSFSLAERLGDGVGCPKPEKLTGHSKFLCVIRGK